LKKIAVNFFVPLHQNYINFIHYKVRHTPKWEITSFIAKVSTGGVTDKSPNQGLL